MRKYLKAGPINSALKPRAVVYIQVKKERPIGYAMLRISRVVQGNE